MEILLSWNERLIQNKWLVGDKESLADIAIPLILLSLKTENRYLL